ncbi:MAG: 2-amino-4-hydroxy-6-hydroxymethyldihydropteridine diphosphokinase [Pseudomonadota bacterium]|nr:2-amino-4-hydroxy-6-hydroxymethyldihydropteridine diphosphokinase [Pseudomonadota bacterium]
MTQAFKIAYIGLGSNLGNRAEHIHNAVQALNCKNIQICAVSNLYETNPVEVTEQQPKYLNAVIRISTDFSMTDLHQLTMTIEQSMGRLNKGQRQPRTIDLDILLYDTDTFFSDTLEIPHPRMTQRQFVLVPLRDVLTTGWPSYFPDINQLCESFEDSVEVIETEIEL